MFEENKVSPEMEEVYNMIINEMYPPTNPIVLTRLLNELAKTWKPEDKKRMLVVMDWLRQLLERDLGMTMDEVISEAYLKS